jgi:hypothetical protein
MNKIKIQMNFSKKGINNRILYDFIIKETSVYQLYLAILRKIEKKEEKEKKKEN